MSLLRIFPVLFAVITVAGVVFLLFAEGFVSALAFFIIGGIFTGALAFVTDVSAGFGRWLDRLISRR